MPGRPIRPVSKMTVDDRIDLVDAAARLVDALRIERDDPLGSGEPVEEQRHRALGEAADVGGLCNRLAGDLLQRGFGAGGRSIHERAVDSVARCKMREQPVEQHRIAARAKRQVQIGAFTCRGPPRIDDDNAAGRVVGLGGHHALVKDRMAPGGVGADEDQEIGGFEIFIAARNGVAAERALVARHARRHAQPRIGIDVGGADEALGELVDDVIVLGQNLAGDVEGDRIRPMLADYPAKTFRDMIERRIPARFLPVDHGCEQPALEADGLGERRAFGAQPPEIGRMQRIAADGHRARGIPVSDDAAADAAIRTGCLHWHAAITLTRRARPPPSGCTARRCHSPPWSDARAYIPRPARPPRRS